MQKKSPFPKYPKITQKFTQNRKKTFDALNVLSGGIQRFLKRERDISRKAMLSDGKTASRCVRACRGDARGMTGMGLN